MPVVGIRELSRDTSRVIKQFEKTGEPIILTREGRPIGALMRFDERQLENLVLATLPEAAEYRAATQEAVDEDELLSPDELADAIGLERPSRLDAASPPEQQALVAGVADRVGFSETQAEKAVEAVLDTIQETLCRGGEISFTGFGKFTVAERGAREARNPQTGERIQVAASRVPRFSAGTQLKEAVKRTAG